MQILAIETVPLDGVRLIEASAGTGKTYTIAGLYVRMLLERALTVEEILVVTFTRAATQELRGRIAQRVREALAWIGGGRRDGCDELIRVMEGLDDETAERRLRDALTNMDRAAVFTIHGFCQRVLQDYAFESGALFETDLLADSRDLILEVIQDFWRHRFHAADAELAMRIRSQWTGPRVLAGEVGRLLAAEPGALIPAVTDQDRVQAYGRLKRAAQAVCSAWRTQGPAVRGLLNDSDALSRARTNYAQARLDAAYHALDAFCARPRLGRLPENFELLCAERLQAPGSLKKNKAAPRHSFLDSADELMASWTAYVALERAAVLREAAAFGRRALEQRKARLRVVAYDDLLIKLDAALAGEGGDALASRIRGRYPVASIDEFQDTDPVQYRIFRRVYLGHAGSALFLIGDPKQAIYSFRGADVFTYMAARRDTDRPGGHFTLATNWRSHSGLVEAVNRLFGRVSAPFVYDRDIPFVPVRAAGRADGDSLRKDGKGVAPVVTWHVPRPSKGAIAKKAAFPVIARAVAREAGRLIRLGAEGRMCLGQRPLVAGDLAVLVRDRYEAEHVRHALNAAGIASVYLSRDSVFAAPEAEDLSRVLHAVVKVGDQSALRAALCTDLLGLDAHGLAALEDNEVEWQAWVDAFEHAHMQWLQRGFLPMFFFFMGSQGIGARLRRMPDGERRLSNLYQLAELIQGQGEQLGLDQLLRWLDVQRMEPDGDQEEQQLRLESDEALVQIVTVHKSKGLEYPIVFLPFLWNAKPIRDTGGVLAFHDESTGERRFDLGSPDRGRHLSLAERERLAEDLRLLYVALTRARQRVYTAWGGIRGAELSAMAYLLHGADRQAALPDVMPDDETLRRDLEGFGVQEGLTEVLALSEAAPPRIVSGAAIEAGRFSAQVDTTWRVSSFTGLADMRETRSERSAREVATPTIEATSDTPFGFPAGARAGTFLHALLERIDPDSTQGPVLDDLVSRLLGQFGFEPRWAPVVCQWMMRVLDTPLGDADLPRLRDVPSEKRLTEMGFNFPVARLEDDKLAALSRLVTDGDGARTWMPAVGALRGLMTGYIDLVFEFEGRYFLVDYKSNHLGTRPSDYERGRLETAMVEHDYDLQYLIYTVATHRYLSRRVPGYRYDTHFGGVLYLFLRGMDPQTGDRYGVYCTRPDPDRLNALNELFSNRGVAIGSLGG